MAKPRAPRRRRGAIPAHSAYDVVPDSGPRAGFEMITVSQREFGTAAAPSAQEAERRRRSGDDIRDQRPSVSGALALLADAVVAVVGGLLAIVAVLPTYTTPPPWATVDAGNFRQLMGVVVATLAPALVLTVVALLRRPRLEQERHWTQRWLGAGLILALVAAGVALFQFARML